MNREKLLTAFKVIAIPTGYAIILRLFFGVSTWMDMFSVMSISFLFCLPTVVGALTVYFSSLHKVKIIAYRIFAPWMPIILFMVVTILVTMEGWACWLMVLPLFFIAASVGGLIGGYFKMRKQDTKLYLSVLALLPLFISPLESLVDSIPGTYEAYTHIDIAAPVNKSGIM
jgi:hypothetical protein